MNTKLLRDSPAVYEPGARDALMAYRRSTRPIPFPGLEDVCEEMIEGKVNRCLDYLTMVRLNPNATEHDENGMNCYDCGKPCGLKIREYAFKDAFDEHPGVYFFCGQAHADEYRESFTFICEDCDRVLANSDSSCRPVEKDPIVWLGRTLGDGAQICKKCFQERCLKDGMPKHWFANSDGSPRGDFLWVDIPLGDLRDAGFAIANDRTVIGHDAETANRQALGYLKKGNAVVMNAWPGSDMGFSADVEIWVRPKEKK